MSLLVRPVQIRHGFVALVQKDERTPQYFVGQRPNMLVAALLCAREKPHDLFDDYVGYQRAKSSLPDLVVDVCSFIEIGNQTVCPNFSTIADDDTCEAHLLGDFLRTFSQRRENGLRPWEMTRNRF